MQYHDTGMILLKCLNSGNMFFKARSGTNFPYIWNSSFVLFENLFKMSWWIRLWVKQSSNDSYILTSIWVHKIIFVSQQLWWFKVQVCNLPQHSFFPEFWLDLSWLSRTNSVLLIAMTSILLSSQWQLLSMSFLHLILAVHLQRSNQCIHPL